MVKTIRFLFFACFGASVFFLLLIKDVFAVEKRSGDLDSINQSNVESDYVDEDCLGEILQLIELDRIEELQTFYSESEVPGNFLSGGCSNSTGGEVEQDYPVLPEVSAKDSIAKQEKKPGRFKFKFKFKSKKKNNESK